MPASINTGSAPSSSQSCPKALDARSFEAAVERACKALLAVYGEIMEIDKIAGDGDRLRAYTQPISQRDISSPLLTGR